MLNWAMFMTMWSATLALSFLLGKGAVEQGSDRYKRLKEYAGKKFHKDNAKEESL